MERRGDVLLYIGVYAEEKCMDKKKGTTGRLVAASADDDAELNY